MKQNNETELILKVLAKHATSEEELRFSDWLTQSEKNQMQFEAWKAMWQNVKDPAAHVQPNVEQAWKKITQESAWNSSSKTRRLNLSFSSFFKIAASVSLLLCSVWLFKQYYVIDKPSVIIYTSGQAIEHISLPDHSSISLQPHSTLHFLRNFEDKNRAVTLEGEAFFDITKDKEHPFTITTEQAKVVVLGTSFTIKAIPVSGKTEVIVKTGIVSVESKTLPGDKVKLMPGHSAIVIDQHPIAKVQPARAKDLLTQTGSFDFKQTELSIIIKQLNEHFGVPILIENKAVVQCTYTGSFRKASLHEIIAVIATTMNLQYQQEGEHYLLKGNSCP